MHISPADTELAELAIISSFGSIGTLSHVINLKFFSPYYTLDTHLVSELLSGSL